MVMLCYLLFPLTIEPTASGESILVNVLYLGYINGAHMGVALAGCVQCGFGEGPRYRNLGNVPRSQRFQRGNAEASRRGARHVQEAFAISGIQCRTCPLPQIPNTIIVHAWARKSRYGSPVKPQVCTIYHILYFLYHTS